MQSRSRLPQSVGFTLGGSLHQNWIIVDIMGNTDLFIKQENNWRLSSHEEHSSLGWPYSL